MPEPARYDVVLPGCTPEPLMAYLKALGILRLVSEQKDADARGWWSNDVFWLRSPVLFHRQNSDRQIGSELVEFFLKEYRPTPLLAPWNAGSGFYLKWDEKKASFKKREASDALLAIESSTAERFHPYRAQVAAVKRRLQERADPIDPDKQVAEARVWGQREGWSKRRGDSEVKKLLDGQMLLCMNGRALALKKVDKDRLILDVRSCVLDDAAIRWIDSAFVIRTGQKKNRIEAPLLGSGGNIGNSDFSTRFMGALASSLPLRDDAAPGDESVALLHGALFGGATHGLAGTAVDQFDPGHAGGANMHQGMEAASRLNPWDYIFMLEGAIVLQSASSRRLATDVSGSVFPFSVESTAAGFTSPGLDETRGEQWLPLWHRASTSSEIETLLAEGRSYVGRRQARTATDFARAASSLGVDRGIRQFVRVQYQKRFGDNYLANVLGRVDTVPRAPVDLLCEIDGWLDRFRRQVSSAKDAPARFGRVLRSIDSAVFDFCRYGGSCFFQRILVALGRAEHELATAERFREKHKLRPVGELSPAWLNAANDASPEWAVALGLAALYDPEYKVGPVRANLEAVDWKKNCRAWADKDRAVVWNAADLVTNLTNVLGRRMMDGARAGCEQLPMALRFPVPLGIAAAFIEGTLDDECIANLIWGLALVDSRRRGDQEPLAAGRLLNPPPLPREFALLKLLFLPGPLAPERVGDRVRWHFARKGEAHIAVRPDPRILPLLHAGRVGDACRIATRRLRVSGLSPMPVPIHGISRDGIWSQHSTDVRRGQRLAAALLIPIGSGSVNRLVHLVCRADAATGEAHAVSAEGESE